MKTSPDDEDHALKENMVSLIKSLPPRSSHRRVLLSPVAEIYKWNFLSAQIGIMKKNLASSGRYFSVMKRVLPIERTVVNRGKFDTVTVERCFRFILNDANVQQISLGKKPVLIDGKIVDFPKLVRKKIITYMFRDYAEKYPDSRDRLGEYSFQNILQRLLRPMTRKVEMR